MTGVVLAYLGSSSLAGSVSMVEKMMSTEVGSKVDASSTTMLAMSAGSSSGHHQRIDPLASRSASIYFFVADRSDATSLVILNQGCPKRLTMACCPTIPVAPTM